jgi:hypothetical protein
VFDLPIFDAKNVSVKFVGVLKDIQIWLWYNAYSCGHL